MNKKFMNLFVIILLLNILTVICSCNKKNCTSNENNVVTIKIGVYDVAQSDPFNENYVYNETVKLSQQQNQKRIEEKYNVKIEYISKKEVYSNYFSGLVDGYRLKQFIDDNDLDLMLVDYYEIRTLKKEYNYLLPLSEKIVNDQLDIFNKLTMYEQNVYGYAYQNQMSNKYLYYNLDMIEEYNLQDPLELWYQGKWNVTSLSNYYNNNYFPKKLFQGDLNNFMIGLVHSLGGKYFDTKLNSFNSETNIKMLLTTEKLKKLGFVAQDNSERNEFIYQNCLFTDKYISNVDFKMGIVPYPLSDDAVVEVITTEKEIESKELYNQKKIKTEDGLYIKGINLFNSGYSIPLNECISLSIINKENKKDIELLSNIIVDLCQISESNKATFDAIINNLFDSIIYQELIYETNEYMSLEIFNNIDLNRHSITPPKYLWPLMVLKDCENETKEEIKQILIECDEYFLEYYNKHILNEKKDY